MWLRHKIGLKQLTGRADDEINDIVDVYTKRALDEGVALATRELIVADAYDVTGLRQQHNVRLTKRRRHQVTE